MVISVDRQVKGFDGAAIKINSVVDGYATQVGTRNVTDGTVKLTPVLLGFCLNHVIQ